MPKKLPTITSFNQLLPYLKIYQQVLDPILARPQVLKAPWNFRATRKRGGILLQWSTVLGADGYEILRSDTADFANPVIIPIGSGVQNAYFDGLGGSPETRSYKIRATSGTISEPHVVKGALSGIVSATSIDSTDTVTSETTTRDTTLTDIAQTLCVAEGTFIVPLGEVVRRELREVSQDWFYLETSNYSLMADPTHPVYTESGLKRIKDIEVGERVITHGGLQAVLINSSVHGKHTKLVIEVDGELFWSNWILSHNKPKQLL